ncbi:class I SAM-dependent methyltransferase [Thiolapillus sp.]
MAERLSADQWAAWWKNRTITSFQGAFTHNYDGPIEKFWTNRFSRLPDEASILDLGTGNGALALLAAEHAHEHHRAFHITGIDFAHIQPLQLQEENPQLQAIHFIANTPMEATGLATGSQDLIMSQFGFEYGDMQATLKEVRRLLKPDCGCFSAMIHHQDSAVLKQAREALQQIRHCEKSGLMETAEQLVQLQQQVARNKALTPKQQQQAQRLHQLFTRETEKLKRYAQTLKDPSHVRMFTHNLLFMFDRRNASRITPEQRLQAITKLRQESENYRRRMKDLRSAAYSDKDLAALQRGLEKFGFAVRESARQDYGGQYFCHRISACLSPKAQ